MTGRAKALLLTAAVIIGSSSYAQDLESYRQKYDDALKKISAHHQQRIADINKTYASDLDALKARVQAAGELNNVKAVMEEISRFTPVPSDVHLRQWWGQ